MASTKTSTMIKGTLMTAIFAVAGIWIYNRFIDPRIIN